MRKREMTAKCARAERMGVPGIPGANAKTPEGRKLLSDAARYGTMPHGGDPTRMYPSSNGVREGVVRDDGDDTEDDEDEDD